MYRLLNALHLLEYKHKVRLSFFHTHTTRIALHKFKYISEHGRFKESRGRIRCKIPSQNLLLQAKLFKADLPGDPLQTDGVHQLFYFGWHGTETVFEVLLKAEKS